MEYKDFDKVLENRIQSMRTVLASKQKEYATGGDRLHNFKRAAATLQTIPEQALLGMFVKHLVSIMDMVDDIGYPCKAPASIAQWDEKIGDAVNYLVLLEALVIERNNESIDRDLQNMPHA